MNEWWNDYMDGWINEQMGGRLNRRIYLWMIHEHSGCNTG